MKGQPPRIVVDAICAAMRGRRHIDEAVMQAVLEYQPVELTHREDEVLAHLASGASNKAIAAALGVSIHTVEFHVGNVTRKLGAESRSAAVARARRRGTVTVGDRRTAVT
jgi:two-component system NarL family response regulator